LLLIQELNYYVVVLNETNLTLNIFMGRTP